jgi:Fur family transcriptional regulator, iron response regulator
MLRQCQKVELEIPEPQEWLRKCGSVLTRRTSNKGTTVMDLSNEVERKEISTASECKRCGLCNGACITRDAGIMLGRAGFRLTRQRLELARLLFQDGDHHITADSLHEDARRKGIKVSLATVYNTLQQFTGAGLLRRLSIDGQKTWYDTNTSEHHHFFCEDDSCVIDIADGQVTIGNMPAVPEGMEIARVEVIVRLRRC